MADVSELERQARELLRPEVYDYYAGGSGGEVTLRANEEAWRRVRFLPRVLRDVSAVRTGVQLGPPLNLDLRTPLAVAPTAFHRLAHTEGEAATAAGAARAGALFVLSTRSSRRIEDVAAAVAGAGGSWWFQVYLMRDRGFNQELIARARAAQCSALVLTVDLQVQGLRRRDPKNGLSIPPRLTLRNALDIATKPGWALRVLCGKRRSFGNLVGLGRPAGLTTLSAWIASQFDPSVTWQDIAWVRSLWPGKLIIKGILDAEDARTAAAQGVDAIVVSNHGGRQLDGAPSSISVLPEIVNAVAGRCEVWMDGGVQSGQDMLRALALGAKACLIGKSFLYALGAMGGAGVTLALNLLRRELEVSLALTGRTDIRQVDASILRVASVPRSNPG